MATCGRDQTTQVSLVTLTGWRAGLHRGRSPVVRTPSGAAATGIKLGPIIAVRSQGVDVRQCNNWGAVPLPDGSDR